MNQAESRDNARCTQTASRLPGNRRLTSDHEPDSRFPTAVRASVQSPAPGVCASHMDHSASEVLHITEHLRNIDRKFQNFRELFEKGEVISGPVEAKLADLLQALSSFRNTYPALTGDAIQPAVATLITSINGKSITCETDTGIHVQVKRMLLQKLSSRRSVIIKVYSYSDLIFRENRAFKMYESTRKV